MIGRWGEGPEPQGSKYLNKKKSLDKFPKTYDKPISDLINADFHYLVWDWTLDSAQLEHPELGVELLHWLTIHSRDTTSVGNEVNLNRSYIVIFCAFHQYLTSLLVSP